MFWANVSHNSLKISGKELLTVGSSKANFITFNFSKEWDGLTRIAVFRTPSDRIAIRLQDGQSVVAIPWECYRTVGDSIAVGVYGTNSSNETILPTIWAELGRVVDATTVFDAEQPSPTETILATLVDAVTALGENVQTYSQHPNLSDRDRVEQHPIAAITGLTNSLDEKLTRDDYLTTDEVLKLIGGTNNA